MLKTAKSCCVTLSANAGVSIQIAGMKLWVDALHCESKAPFSSLNPRIIQQMRDSPAFQKPDLLYFTHCHGDHFSKALTEMAMQRYPEMCVALPEPHFTNQLLLNQTEMDVKVKNAEIHFFRIPHEGREYKAVPHYGALIHCDGIRILITGDAEIASPRFLEVLGGQQIDLALLDFPWFTLRNGREFMEQYVRPKHVILNHLPFQEDDFMGYRKATFQAVERYRQMFSSVNVLAEPLQHIVLDFEAS